MIGTKRPDPDPRLSGDRIRRATLRAQETLELVEVDPAMTAGCQVSAEVPRPDPAPQRGNRDATVSRRLPGRELLATPSGPGVSLFTFCTFDS
jgi:hypothetical protein